MAGSQNLGSLTLNLIADLGQYTVPLDKAERQTAKAMRAMENATRQLNRQFETVSKSLEREIALYGEVTRAVQIRYEIEKGALKGLSDEQKKSLTAMAAQLDALDAAAGGAQGSMRGIRGVATGLGYQVQDIAVQLQAGTNAFMVLGQQGSQIASLFGPTGAIVGAFIAIGGAIAGSLLPSLFKTGDAAEDTADKVASLVSELNDLDEAQKRLVLTANQYNISDQTKAYEEQGKAIETIRKEIEKIQSMPENTAISTSVTMGTGGLAAGSAAIALDKTELLADATRRLNAAEVARLATLKQIRYLQDPTGGMQEIANLNRELELIGLTGRALYEKMADQKGYTEGLREEFIALSMLIEAREKEVDLAEEAAKKAEEAAKKAAQQEKTRAENIEKLIKAMEREADLFGVTSRAAQVEYDILTKTLDVQNGLYGIEGQRLLLAAQRIDQLEKEAQLNEVLNIEIDARIEAQNKAAKDFQKAQEEALKDTQRQYDQFFERIDKVGADVWTSLLEGSTSVFDSIKKLFLSTLGEMAHAAVTRPIILQFQQQFMPAATGGSQAGAGQVGQAGSAIAAGGIYAAIAVAVVAGVSIWNKSQEEKFKELTAEFRQGTQSTGTLLGLANAKSDSINQAIENLTKYADDTLSVNESMLRTLNDIKSGIAGVAAGFARQLDLTGGIGVSGVETGRGTLGINEAAKSFGQFQFRTMFDPLSYIMDNPITDFVVGFMDGITDSISKNVYSKKKKVIDSGIQIMGSSLAEVLDTGAIEAFAYAAVETKKKVLGVTTSKKVKTQTDELSDVLLTQFASVFEGAGEALSQSAAVFGLDFNNYVNKFLIDATKLSLKGLEGDELTREIESFFSSTLDKWAGILVEGSDILLKFQEVGEGAFETVIRLASELNTFNYYVDTLDLNFKATGFAAVEASQAIADAAGGFDKLTSSLGTYYENFFTAEEQAAKQMESLTKVFNDLGVEQIPQTREEFRRLVESLDLTNTENQKLFATLIGLSGAFAEVVGEVSEEVMSLADLVKNAFSSVQRAVDAEREALDKANDIAVEQIEESLRTHQDLANALSSTLGSMTLQSEKYQAQARRQAQAELIAANAIVRAGGPLPNLDKLAPALEALASPSTGMFSTFEEYAKDFYVTQNALKELEAAAGEQVSADEQALIDQEKYYQGEVERLDKILAYYQKQIDIMEGVDNSVLTVVEAVNNLNAALTGVVPNSSAQSMAALAASSVRATSTTLSPENYGSMTLPSLDKSFSDILSEIKGLRGDLEVSQFAIAKNTSQSNTLLQRWETDGLPPEREEL